jgi:hypothetical protein
MRQIWSVQCVGITVGSLRVGELDLVHTWAVLIHAPARGDRVVIDLVRSLRRGSWLLLEEGDPIPRVSPCHFSISMSPPPAGPHQHP